MKFVQLWVKQCFIQPSNHSGGGAGQIPHLLHPARTTATDDNEKHYDRTKSFQARARASTLHCVTIFIFRNKQQNQILLTLPEIFFIIETKGSQLRNRKPLSRRKAHS